MKQLEKMLNKHGISPTSTNIIEDSILRLAGISITPIGSMYHFDSKYDSIIAYEGLPKKELDQLLYWLNTLSETKANRCYAYLHNAHWISMDHATYKKMMPLLYRYIDNMLTTDVQQYAYYLQASPRIYAARLRDFFVAIYKLVCNVHMVYPSPQSDLFFNQNTERLLVLNALYDLKNYLERDYELQFIEAAYDVLMLQLRKNEKLKNSKETRDLVELYEKLLPEIKENCCHAPAFA